MKSIILAATIMLAGTQAFAESCTDSYGRCLKPRGDGVCDAQCQSYCKGERAQCMTTGTFTTRNTSRTGLDRK